MVKILLLVALCAGPVYAQQSSTDALTAAGCGSENVEFQATRDKNAHPTPTPDPGKALVFLIGNTRGDTGVGVGKAVTRIGIDGQWVAANALGAYVSFAVEPGDHRLCINYQTVIKRQGHYFTAKSFTAVAGQTYYFRTRDAANPSPGQSVILQAMDPAEALVLIAKTGHSTFTQKK